MIGLVVDNTAPDNVVKLDTINLADIAGTIRGIADDIEKGELGQVDRAILILVGDDGEPITVGCGTDCNRVMTLGVLEYAKHRFVQSLDAYDDE